MTHYDEKYFEWQKSSGQFGANVDIHTFCEYINPNDNVIDFGCGGGYLLAKINCKNKIGIEINDSAIEQAKNNGISIVKSANEIDDGWADVVISNHALEHTYRPLDEIKNLMPKIKKNGTLIFTTPFEIKSAFHEEDINQHLYTWSPLNLGNLFKTAGYRIVSVEILKHRWPPYAKHIYKYFGWRIFNFCCKIYARFKGDLYQVKIIAKKK